jgi:hypothetical protein
MGPQTTPYEIGPTMAWAPVERRNVPRPLNFRYKWIIDHVGGICTMTWEESVGPDAIGLASCGTTCIQVSQFGVTPREDRPK